MQEFYNVQFTQAIPNILVEKFFDGIELWIKREDLLHPEVSGNKFRKLKYNLRAAREKNYSRILTFGGAYSNHITATAAAGKLFDFKTIGVIRGEELAFEGEKELNPSLQFAENCGMHLYYVTREAYRLKENPEFIDSLRSKFGDFYLLPEGGTNRLAIKGCSEILNEKDADFNFICSAVGTGGTLAGLINASKSHQKILGFSALNSAYLSGEIANWVTKNNWQIILKYHFGGYAKVNTDLIEFINNFKKKYKIILDPVYTGKLLFGIFDLVKNNYFPKNSKILAIHTGGLQGIKGMNEKLKSKNLPQIKI